jgi:putative tryptophan/tyrosine transport system substrate-binding protein
MRRRDFISLIGGAAVACPLAGRAQQGLPVVGFLNSGAAAPMASRVAAFLKGLAETGHAEGRDFVIEYRWAEGDYDRLLAFAAEFVRRPVNVIAAGGDGRQQSPNRTSLERR